MQQRQYGVFVSVDCSPSPEYPEHLVPRYQSVLRTYDLEDSGLYLSGFHFHVRLSSNRRSSYSSEQSSPALFARLMLTNKPANPMRVFVSAFSFVHVSLLCTQRNDKAIKHRLEHHG